MMPKYAIGLDYGSLSLRALLVDTLDGREVANSEYIYPHGVMTQTLPDGTPLPECFALQHPDDYLKAISQTVKELVRCTGIQPGEIAGIGIDFTASTILPVNENGLPLCFMERFQSEPHAYVKLWKHHGAMKYADKIQILMQKTRPGLNKSTGGVITCEGLWPKLIEMAEEAPDLYNAATYIMEAADWIVWQLTGVRVRSIAIAACNGLYRDSSYPDKEFISMISKRAAETIYNKLSGEFSNLGSRAGVLTESAAELLGLCPGIPVGTAIIDSHASVSASGARMPGDMTLIVGTSAVELLLTDCAVGIPGVHISAQNASIPGLYTIGAGQCSVGDTFDWFIKNCVPCRYTQEAEKAGVDVYQYLQEKASGLVPGKIGVIALDWWNGARTPWFKFNLTGMILGLNLNTKPEDIYRALLEASVFSARRAIKMFDSAGCQVKRIFAAGGIPGKNPLMMQIYADVLGLPVSVCSSKQTGALGSAIFGAAAADETRNISDIIDHMSSTPYKTYCPIEENKSIYNALYAEYIDLSNEYAKPGSVMDQVIKIRNRSF